MPTPFPGMDPYLERPGLWPDVHSRLIVQIADTLAPLLRPRYYVSVEERTYRVEPGDLVFAGRADVAVVQPRASGTTTRASPRSNADVVVVEVPMLETVRETYLEVRAAGDDQVITLLEVLSPTNKRQGEGRSAYLQKRRAVLASLTHLVEIDLLRAGEPMPTSGFAGRSDYRILVSRAHQRPQAELRPFSVRQPIPPFALPLRPGDDEPELALTPILHALYERAGYDLRVDYRGEPEPPLAPADAAWAAEVLRAAHHR